MIDYINSINWEFFVALAAIITSVFAIYTQRAHNRLTFKPIPIIQKFNYNNRLKILLWNKGTGPMFIISFTIKDVRGNSVKVANSMSEKEAHGFMDIVPIETRQLAYVDFISNPIERVVAPTESLNMIEFKIRDDDSKHTVADYDQALKKIKKSLHNVVVHIEYSNIYKNKKTYISQVIDFDNLVNEVHSVRKIKETLIERENNTTSVKKINRFKDIFRFRK